MQDWHPALRVSALVGAAALTSALFYVVWLGIATIFPALAFALHGLGLHGKGTNFAFFYFMFFVFIPGVVMMLVLPDWEGRRRRREGRDEAEEEPASGVRRLPLRFGS